MPVLLIEGRQMTQEGFTNLADDVRDDFRARADGSSTRLPS